MFYLAMIQLNVLCVINVHSYVLMELFVLTYLMKMNKRNVFFRLLAVCLAIGTLAALVFSFASCGWNDRWNFEPIDTEYKGTTLYVYNWGEYISDGTDGSLKVIKAFEKVYGIKVKYSYYSTNEELYAQLLTGASYDVVIPSDYMIERLIKEDLIQKIDTSDLKNYENVAPEYKGLYFDPKDEYSVPYSVGMVGIVYDTTKVSQAEVAEQSWSLLWSQNYTKGDLRAGILCANKGILPDSVPAIDLAGKPRIIGSAIDIGCYEAPNLCTMILFQ